MYAAQKQLCRQDREKLDRTGENTTKRIQRQKFHRDLDAAAMGMGGSGEEDVELGSSSCWTAPVPWLGTALEVCVEEVGGWVCSGLGEGSSAIVSMAETACGWAGSA